MTPEMEAVVALRYIGTRQVLTNDYEQSSRTKTNQNKQAKCDCVGICMSGKHWQRVFLVPYIALAWIRRSYISKLGGTRITCRMLQWMT